MPSGCGRRPHHAADRPGLWTTRGPPLWAVDDGRPRRVAGVSLEQTVERGWEVLRLTWDSVSVTVVPGLGGTVTSLEVGGSELLARTPWGLPQRGAPALPGGAEAAMLDTSPGGWQPLFPYAGHSGSYSTEGPFDGEARLASMDWTATDSSLELRVRLRRTPFVLTRTVSVLGGEVTLRETVRNVGAEAVEAVWGHRLLLGGDLVAAGTVIDAPASVVRSDPSSSSAASFDDLLPWPRAYAGDGLVNLRTVPAPGSGSTRTAYLCELARPSVRISRPATGLALELEWDTEVWPYLWYELEAGGRVGYPWYGTGYHLALSPASGWPASGLADVRRNSGTELALEPGSEQTASLTLRPTAAR